MNPRDLLHAESDAILEQPLEMTAAHADLFRHRLDRDVAARGTIGSGASNSSYVPRARQFALTESAMADGGSWKVNSMSQIFKR